MTALGNLRSLIFERSVLIYPSSALKNLNKSDDTSKTCVGSVVFPRPLSPPATPDWRVWGKGACVCPELCDPLPQGEPPHLSGPGPCLWDPMQGQAPGAVGCLYLTFSRPFAAAWLPHPKPGPTAPVPYLGWPRCLLAEFLLPELVHFCSWLMCGVWLGLPGT